MMQIEKNIAATLKNDMMAHGEKLTAFSTRLGVPLSTLQGYLKGTSSPRADTIEDLAGKLGMTPAELVSGWRLFSGRCASGLDSVALEVQALHPLVKSTAEGALLLLRSMFHLSDSLFQKDEPSAQAQNPYQYLLHEMRIPFRGTVSYGILVKELLPDGWTTVAVVGAFSQDGEAVDRLAKCCTALQLSPDHLLDVVHDFLASHD